MRYPCPASLRRKRNELEEELSRLLTARSESNVPDMWDDEIREARYELAHARWLLGETLGVDEEGV